MTANRTKFNPYWVGRAPAERCKMTVHIYFDFIFSLMVQQKHSAGSANFSSNFWLLVLTSFCFSLTASSFLLAFAWFDLAISIMTHTTFAPCEPWNLKTGQPATYLHLLKAAHQSFAFHPLPPAPSCLTSLLYLSTISSLFLHPTSSAFNFSPASFLFFSASFSPSCLLWYMWADCTAVRRPNCQGNIFQSQDHKTSRHLSQI